MKVPDTRVPVLSRRSTSVLTNGDMPKLKTFHKRKSSSQRDGSLELKRKRSSEREAIPPTLGKKTSSVSPSIVRKASNVKLPAKRVRKPKKFFEIIHKSTSKKSGGTSTEKVFLYFSGEYLAIRADDGKFWLRSYCFIFQSSCGVLELEGLTMHNVSDLKEFFFFSAEFYLCRALQHVYDTTKTFRIMWLDAVDGTQDVYSKEYMDTTEATFKQFSC